MSGPNDRAGFIDAPLIGLDQRPASVMYPPTAIADSGPTFWADDAVPRIVLTSPNVSSASVAVASRTLTPGPGSVAPSIPILPNIAHSSRHAAVAPANWTTM